MTADGFFAPLLRSLDAILEFLPRLFALFAILLLGLVVAWLIRRAVRALLSAMRIESLSSRIGLPGAFGGAGFERPLPDLGADFVWLLVFLTFLTVGLDALDPESGGALVLQFHAFLPRILIAALIVVVGWAVGTFIAQAALVTGVNSGFRLARPVSLVLQFLTVAVAIAMALEQLGIAQGIVTSAFALSFGGIIFAFALAFGIGGADLAKRALETRLGDSQGRSGDDRPDELSHV